MILTLALRMRWSSREADPMCGIVVSIVRVWLVVGSVFMALEIASTERTY